MVPTFSCRFPRRLFCQCSILLCLPRLGLWRKRSSSLAALWENRAELEVEEEDRESLRGPLKETTLTLWRWLCVRSQKKKSPRWPFEGCQSNRHLHVKDGLLTSKQAPARFLLRSRMSQRKKLHRSGHFGAERPVYGHCGPAVWELYLQIRSVHNTKNNVCLCVWVSGGVCGLDHLLAVTHTVNFS